MDENQRNGERLHKVLARAGVASRRECEELIAQGRVQVNGATITRMGTVVDVDSDSVVFDGEPIRTERPAYFVVYKPKGVVCTTRDQFDRTSVVDLVRDRHARRLFPVGRMEEDSEGLILVTNDGAFANRIVSYKHPLRYVYHVRLRGQLTQEALQAARAGVWLSDGKSGPMYVKVSRWGKRVSTVLCSPSANQHRLLKRVWAKVGLVADGVVRVRMGSLTTEGLKKGAARRLTEEEIHGLLHPDAGDVGLPMERRRTSRRHPRGARQGSKPVGRSPQKRRGKQRRSEGEDPPARRRVVGP